MHDYTIDIQAKIKQEEARRENDRRFLIREIEAAKRANLDKQNKSVQPPQRQPDYDAHN
jgi:hypothetical protein